MNLTLTDRPAHSHPFHGIGVEADCFIYDETNRAAGITDADIEKIERRLRALSPAITRLFVCIEWFNPSFDGKTFDWSLPYVGHLIRQLRLLDSIGTRANLVLFQPHPPHPAQVEPLIEAMVALLLRLRDTEGLRNLAWTTLYNEPDSMYLHDSPLSRSIFGERFAKQPPFSEYVRLNQLFLRRLKESGLYPGIRLVVADTVWGHPMRVERMKLCAEAFKNDDVDFSYHNYNPEDPDYYTGNPNYAYPGMAREAKLFRRILGPERELILWEFNAAAKGFGAFFPGIGPHGTDMISSIDAAVTVADKIMTIAREGVAGACLWCFHDMLYLGGHKAGAMGFGLFRYKWQMWYPRPLYHYAALLARSFRPGITVLKTSGSSRRVATLAARTEAGTVLALLNRSNRPVRLSIAGLPVGELERRRVYPDLIPDEGDLPAAGVERLSVEGPETALTLAPSELTVFAPCALKLESTC